MFMQPVVLLSFEELAVCFCFIFSNLPLLIEYGKFIAQYNYKCLTSNEPCHEKTVFLHICENKDADQLRGNREADQRLCFPYIGSKIPLLSKYEISSL